MASAADNTTTSTAVNNSNNVVIRGLSNRIADRAGYGVLKFKSIPPPSLPISPPSLSPSSYFSFPSGLSPSDLLDSPVLLPSSNVLPSPTTGTFPAQSFNSIINPVNSQQNSNIKLEDTNSNYYYSDFSYLSQTEPLYNPPPSTGIISSFQSSNSTISTDQAFTGKKEWNFPQIINQNMSFSPEMANLQTNHQIQSNYPQSVVTQSIREQKRSDDGYNWRKYGQKQVKGSENPRSYYKCTFPNCPTKKKVERSLDGQVTEIEYKGSHNHPKPQSTRRSLSNSQFNHPTNENLDYSYTSPKRESAENSSVSMGDDEFEQSSEKSKSMGDDFEEDEPEAKKWKESENEMISSSSTLGAGNSRTVREPRVVVQTTSDIDILDDGYRWRKYGQKVVKGNPNPRSYYKCTYPSCLVRKHVERASHDLRAVITTYEGKHKHDVPAARGHAHSVNTSTAIRPSPMINHNYNHRHDEPTSQAPFTLEVLQYNGF